MANHVSFFEQVNRNFERAAAHTSHPRGLLDTIKSCNSVYHFTFPLERDSGEVEVIHANLDYVDWVTERFMPEVDYCKEVFLINNAFRAWGHQFLYDRETLKVTMTRIGFEDIKYYQPGVSDDENLRGIESHGNMIECEEINQFEAFAIEGRSPNPKK